jgi:hypothetical protein
MNAFNRAFSLVTGLCLVAWLVAVVPAAIGYAKRFGTFAADDAERTVITIAAIVAFAIFWCLVAVLAKLQLSDWLAARRRRPGR